MTHEKINYVELPVRDIEGTKAFFSKAFGWTFVDYGPDYAAIENAGLDGGFYRSDLVALTSTGSTLVILYSNALEASQSKVAGQKTNRASTQTNFMIDFLSA